MRVVAKPRTVAVHLGRQLATVLSLTTLTAAILAQPAAAVQPLRVSIGGGAAFPARSLVLSVPSRSPVTAARVHVSENGAPIGTETVTPIRSANAGDFGVILAIDTSASMRGAAIANAMAAARALAAQRSGAQALGMVLFAQKPRISLGLTQDPQAIQQTLSQQPAVGGITHKPTAPIAKARHIYDGVQLALQQLTAAHIVSGAVIVLSNGADQGSQTRLQGIADAAGANHIRIFTVGLRNASFHPETLAALARIGGGSFTEANPRQLPQVFTAIEAGLTSKYIVHYQSLEAPGRQIRINVSVDGVAGSAGASYFVATPPATLRTAPRPQAKAFWASSVALALAACGSALLVGLAIAFIMIPGRRSGSLRTRVGNFIGAPTGGVDDALSLLAAHPRGLAERVLERQGWWRGFKENIEIAGFSRQPIQIVRLTAAGTVVGALFLYALTQSVVVILIALLAGPLTTRAIVNRRLQRQRALFAEQLPSHLQEVASALRGGHSLISGLTSVVASAVEPTHKEFQRVLADERLGMPLEQALEPLRVRMANDDLEQLSLVALLGRRTGGNMAEVVDRIADAVRERLELRRELQSLTAQARLSRSIVSALPVVVLVFITVINPHYMSPLFHSATGQILLVVATSLILAGWLVMGRIVNIDA